ncbi:hypothetical protein AX14_003081 [Amanita brunnescens Koide BX004]|nr:hypothetical protein AX14_003081 [Amanita brunnescens Koide BX004]
MWLMRPDFSYPLPAHPEPQERLSKRFQVIILYHQSCLTGVSETSILCPGNVRVHDGVALYEYKNGFKMLPYLHQTMVQSSSSIAVSAAVLLLVQVSTGLPIDALGAENLARTAGIIGGVVGVTGFGGVTAKLTADYYKKRKSKQGTNSDPPAHELAETSHPGPPSGEEQPTDASKVVRRKRSDIPIDELD